MGGLAIFFGFILSVLIFLPLTPELRGMLLGSVVIVILGILDESAVMGTASQPRSQKGSELKMLGLDRKSMRLPSRTAMRAAPI